jgi:hypothetical protein
MQKYLAILVTTTLLVFANHASAGAGVCNAGIGGTGIQLDGVGGTGAKPDGVGGTGVNASSGVGGTGIDSGSGLGGTGVQAEGIGGTGIQTAEGIGGTGIVGVITGFASVCVNGVEVEYDNKTAVDVDGQSASISDLNIGQVVAIDAASNRDQLKALRISVSHAMVGKLEKINLAQNSLQIMGQSIKISPATLGLTNLQINQTVKLSGLTSSNGLVHAMRLDVAAPDTPSLISGVLDSNSQINGVKIANTGKTDAGSYVQISGQWDGNALQALQVKESAVHRVVRVADNVIVQGLAPMSEKYDLKVQNRQIYTDANTQVHRAGKGEYQSVIVRGKLDSAGKLNARSVEYSPAERLLERGGSKQRPESSELKSTNVDKQDAKHDDKRVDNNNSIDKNDSHAKDKPEITEKVEKIEKTEKVEKSERIEKPETVTRPETISKPERLARPETVTRPEAVARPEAATRREAVSRPESTRH